MQQRRWWNAQKKKTGLKHKRSQCECAYLARDVCTIKCDLEILRSPNTYSPYVHVPVSYRPPYCPPVRLPSSFSRSRFWEENKQSKNCFLGAYISYLLYFALMETSEPLSPTDSSGQQRGEFRNALLLVYIITIFKSPLCYRIVYRSYSFRDDFDWQRWIKHNLLLLLLLFIPPLL